jgi:uridine kinase
MVIERYEQVLKPMHNEFIEPTKRYADVIIPQGGNNHKAIRLMCHFIKNILRHEDGK